MYTYYLAITSVLLGPKIFLSTLFARTIALCTSKQVTA